jgi:hypothetical protein
MSSETRSQESDGDSKERRYGQTVNLGALARHAGPKLLLVVRACKWASAGSIIPEIGSDKLLPRRHAAATCSSVLQRLFRRVARGSCIAHDWAPGLAIDRSS